MLAEFAQLHLRILSFVGSGYAGIKGRSHRFTFRGLPPFLPFFRAAAAFALDLTEPPSFPSAAASFEIWFLFTLSLYLTAWVSVKKIRTVFLGDHPCLQGNP